VKTLIRYLLKSAISQLISINNYNQKNKQMDEDKKYFNALNLILKANYSTLAKLKSEFGCYKRAFENLKETPRLDVETEWQKLQKQKIQLLLAEESEFPSLLKEIPWPPLGIYIKGETPKNEEIRIAVVGTRKATGVGKEITRRLAKELSDNGIVVISGLAFGIDSASHLGALEGSTKTMAVLGNEIGSVYPRQNYKLAKRILENGGCLISEYPLGYPSYPANFIARNRITSGLSIAAIIIEAPEQSGALSTARFAIEQNREVFVVPGPIDNKNYQGSLKLIREGATLITSVKDVLEDLGVKIPRSSSPERSPDRQANVKDKNQLLVIKIIQEAGSPLTIDKISSIAKLEPQVVNQAISFLIIEEIVKETEKGYII